MSRECKTVVERAAQVQMSKRARDANNARVLRLNSQSPSREGDCEGQSSREGDSEDGEVHGADDDVVMDEEGGDEESSDKQTVFFIFCFTITSGMGGGMDIRGGYRGRYL
jgi:hypothetical protein